jgi:hypothetical protein
MVTAQTRQLCCKRSMAIAPVLTELMLFQVSPFLEQSHPDDHGVLPTERLLDASLIGN